jgi:inner membrane protein
MRFSSGTALGKACIVVGVALLLLIPLALLRGLVHERAALRESAFTQVAQGWGGQQLIGGPMLAIPVTVTDDANNSITRLWYVLPESLDINADIVVQDERRSVGIYEVPVYVTKLHATSEFDVGRKIARLMESNPTARLHLESARLLLPVGDPRGLREVLLTENDLVAGTLEPASGFAISVLAAPLRADAGLDNGKRRFEFTMELAGTRSLAFLPLARSTKAKLSGNWAHPGFTRGFLPIERHVAAKGFDARWQILDLNRSYGGSWFHNETSLESLQGTAFGVELVQPVDLYQRAERAVKYGGLFIGLSLLTLFLWEQLAQRPLHPIQYGLMGLALSVFFLLLLALAEHVGFVSAYSIAAAALCTLLGVYLAGAFRRVTAGLSAATLFAAVYALLYLLITSEDYALLAGSLALFGLLTVAMVLTRKMDWYANTATAE